MDYEIRFERAPGRVRVEFNGERIADSTRALVVHETRHAPAYYFPPEDVRMERLAKTAHATHCPFKGNASYWTLSAGGRAAENAANRLRAAHGLASWTSLRSTTVCMIGKMPVFL